MKNDLSLLHIFDEFDTAERYYKETQVKEIKSDLKQALKDAEVYSQEVSKRVTPSWGYEPRE